MCPSYSVGGVVVRKLGPKYLTGLEIFSLFRRLNLTLLFDLGVWGVLIIDFLFLNFPVLGSKLDSVSTSVSELIESADSKLSVLGQDLVRNIKTFSFVPDGQNKHVFSLASIFRLVWSCLRVTCCYLLATFWVRLYGLFDDQKLILASTLGVKIHKDSLLWNWSHFVVLRKTDLDVQQTHLWPCSKKLDQTEKTCQETLLLW